MASGTQIKTPSKIKLDEIPAFDIPNIKYRCLNPLVDSIRLNDFMI